MLLSDAATLKNAALVIAHPGHELCITEWISRVRPVVFILTDGSGYDGIPKLDQTTNLLQRLGATVGSVYGSLSDAAIYEGLLAGDVAMFCEVAKQFADAFAQAQFDYIVCEAIEGFSPTHDLCRLITAAAISRTNRCGPHQTLSYEVNLINRTAEAETPSTGDSIRIRLSDQSLAEKIKAMRAHPHLREEVTAGLDGSALPFIERHPELAAVLQHRIKRMGPEAFRVEEFRYLPDAVPDLPSEPPFYERYGELMVQAGRYDKAIRCRENLGPVAAALKRFVLAERAVGYSG